MRKPLLPLFVLMLMLSTTSWGQTTIDFDSEAGWTQDGSVSSLTAYGNHSFFDQGVTVEGTNILRNAITAQDGFDGALGTYSIRIRNVANAKVVFTVASGGISDFSIGVRRWDGSPIPNYTVKYSVNGGAAWDNLSNIDGSLLTTSNWFTYNGSINNGNNNIQIEIANTGTTERIMIDNFTWSAYSSSPTPTISVSAVSLSNFAYSVNEGPSISQSIVVSGVNLANGIIITPPSNFEISLNNTSFQTTAISLAQTGGSIASTTVYTRMKAGLAGGSYHQNIVISSIGSTNKTIACSGKVMDLSLPFKENFTTDLGFFNLFSETGAQAWYWASFNDETYAYMNGYSGGSNANVDWLISPTFNLTNYTNLELKFREAINYFTSYQDVKVLVSTDYSDQSPASATWTALTVTGRAAGSSWEFADVNPINLSGYAGQAKVTIAFKYISTSSASSGWEISYFSLAGIMNTPVEPTNHVSNFTAVAGNITTTSVELAWNENDGANRANSYLIKASSTAVVPPVNGVDPANDINLTDGTGNIKVPHGTTSYKFDNCSPGTTYHFSIFPCAGTGDKIVYKTESAPTIQASTLVELFAPVIIPVAGTYEAAIEVYITTATIGAAVYYTTDGSEPTTSSALYTEPFSIGEPTMVKAVAAIDTRISSVTKSEFIIEDPQNVVVARPVIAPASGTFYDNVEVIITCVTEGAVIYYTTDGSVPNKSSTQYEGTFTITESMQIKAIAYVDIDFSTIATANYIVIILPDVVAQPIVIPESGTYVGQVEVSITCETEGATIFYTTDGNIPTTESIHYAGPFTITESSWISAIAVLGEVKSDMVTRYYEITVTLPPLEVSTIAELRAGKTDGQIYQFTGNSVITFAMTFRGQKYVQDETAGILIDDNSGIITTSFVIGDGITNLTGSLSNYNGLLQFLPTQDANKADDPGFSITPHEISISELKNNFEEYESELILIKNCSFEQTGNFANGINYNITSNSENVILRSHFYNVDYIGTAISAKPQHITGIALWHYDEAKIVPRSLNDFEEATNVEYLGVISKIYGINKSIVIENIDEKVTHISIFQLDGRVLKTVKNQSNNLTIEMDRSGFYLVVLNNNNLPIQTRKVLLK